MSKTVPVDEYLRSTTVLDPEAIKILRLQGTESRLAQYGTMDWFSNTARNLSNRRMSEHKVLLKLCCTKQCGTEPITMPMALESATSGSSSSAWHRFGYLDYNDGEQELELAFPQ